MTNEEFRRLFAFWISSAAHRELVSNADFEKEDDQIEVHTIRFARILSNK